MNYLDLIKIVRGKIQIWSLLAALMDRQRDINVSTILNGIYCVLKYLTLRSFKWRKHCFIDILKNIQTIVFTSAMEVCMLNVLWF